MTQFNLHSDLVKSYLKDGAAWTAVGCETVEEQVAIHSLGLPHMHPPAGQYRILHNRDPTQNQTPTCYTTNVQPKIIPLHFNSWLLLF